MRVVSVYPEWGLAFRKYGKNLENRSEDSAAPEIGEVIAIHAGKYIGGAKGEPSTRGTSRAARENRAGLEGFVAAARGAGFELSYRVRAREDAVVVDGDKEHEVIRSAIIAVAVVEAILPPGVEEGKPWRFPGSVAWKLKVTPLTHPLRNVKGQQALWRFTKKSREPWAAERLYEELRVRAQLSRGFEIVNAGGTRVIDRAATRTAFDTNKARKSVSRAFGVTPRIRIVGEKKTLDVDEFMDLFERERQLNAAERRFEAAA